MKTYKLDAIILKSRNMREADKILTLYSIQQGKQRVVAHGAAKPKSRKRGAVQPFCYSSLMLHRGKELDSVSQAELKESFPELRTDLDRLAGAAYMAELADGFLGEGEPNQAIFGLLLATLHLMAKGDTQLALRAFEAKLMWLTGFKPELDHCTGCGQSLTGTKVRFGLRHGGLLCPDCAARESQTEIFSRGTVEVLKTIYRWELLKLHQLRVPEALRQELSRLLRSYIEYHLERRLKTAEFMDRLYKNNPGGGTNI